MGPRVLLPRCFGTAAMLLVLTLITVKGQPEDGRTLRYRYHMYLTRLDTTGPEQHVIPVAADSAGIWVMPYQRQSRLDTHTVRNTAVYLPYCALDSLRLQRRRGALVGAGVGAIFGFGLFMALAAGETYLQQSAAGIGGIGAALFMPVGALIGGASKRYKVHCRWDLYLQVLPRLRERCVYPKGMP